MDIVITGRNMHLDASLKEYISKKLGRLEKMYRRIYKCEVILEEEKVRKNTEVILYLKHNRVIAKESADDIYASIDLAADSIKKQLRRLSGRVRSRRRKSVLKRIMGPVGLFGGKDDIVFKEEIVFPEEEGGIKKSNAFMDKPMLPEEAKLELNLRGKDFVMFKNADTGEANVLYRKGDGAYGLIEPSF